MGASHTGDSRNVKLLEACGLFAKNFMVTFLVLLFELAKPAALSII